MEGIVLEAHENDVLAGRGNGPNMHPGNIYFRNLVEEQKQTYTSSQSKNEKNDIISKIIQQIQNRNPSGRFLTRDNKSGLWHSTDYKKIVRKTGQALRERPLPTTSTSDDNTNTNVKKNASPQLTLDAIEYQRNTQQNVKENNGSKPKTATAGPEMYESFHNHHRNDVINQPTLHSNSSKPDYTQSTSESKGQRSSSGYTTNWCNNDELNHPHPLVNNTYAPSEQQYVDEVASRHHQDTTEYHLSAQQQQPSQQPIYQGNWKKEMTSIHRKGSYDSNDDEKQNRRGSFDLKQLLNCKEEEETNLTGSQMDLLMMSMKSIELSTTTADELQSKLTTTDFDEMEISGNFARMLELNELNKSAPPCHFKQLTKEIQEDTTTTSQENYYELSKSLPPYLYNQAQKNQALNDENRDNSLLKFQTLSGRTVAAFNDDNNVIEYRSDNHKLSYDGERFDESMDFNNSAARLNFDDVEYHSS